MLNAACAAENLDVEVTTGGKIVIEPAYLGFLRSQGYKIDGVNEAHTVSDPESQSETGHVIIKATVYPDPKAHPEADIVADKADIWVCDCWDFRNHSADPREGENPTDCTPCKHIKAVSKVEKATADDQQVTL